MISAIRIPSTWITAVAVAAATVSPALSWVPVLDGFLPFVAVMPTGAFAITVLSRGILNGRPVAAAVAALFASTAFAAWCFISTGVGLAVIPSAPLHGPALGVFWVATPFVTMLAGTVTLQRWFAAPRITR